VKFASCAAVAGGCFVVIAPFYYAEEIVCPVI